MDLRILISQQVALPHVLPLEVHVLLQELLLDASLCEGDLQLTAIGVPASAGPRCQT
ncbi:contact-dependent growth inhibition system immunity protein [Streptomyces sp. NPDC001890]|uniref:contact-dependent growth inhibition system immunity protein n=1 Tax=Streptomyces sp. NPDC001890 TaxID=3364620 RepID=UPI0036C2CA31